MCVFLSELLLGDSPCLYSPPKGAVGVLHTLTCCMCLTVMVCMCCVMYAYACILIGTDIG